MKKELLLVALGIALFLAGCGQAPDNLARDLQAKLTTKLDDPTQCPSGTSADVQALINAAGPDGVIQIPAGCYEITDSVGVPAGKRVFGAGMDKTILYRNPDRSRDRDRPIFWVFGRGESETQVSGIAFLGVRDTNDKGEDYGIVLSNIPNFRVDHCYFESFGWAGVRTEGMSRGVIDHSVFVDNFKKGIDNLGYGVVVYGANQWPDDPGAGTADAVFVEDSLFVGNRHAIASSGGAHYVFRYNRVQRNVIACSVDAHGLGFGWSRGTRYVEIYGNTVEEPVYKECGIGIRGGDGVIFGGIGANYEDTAGIGQLRQRVGHGAGTKSRGQTDHGGAVSETGAVIDVVGADGGPGKFLDQVVLFVGDLGGSQHRHCVGAVLLYHPF